LDLTLGETDIPLIIQDKRLDKARNFVYAPGPMAEEMGYEGDVVLANLTPTSYLEVETRIYRLRLLNGSNVRNLRLAFSRANARAGEDELLPYYMIATDASLLERSAQAAEVFLLPAERVDVLVDLSGFEVGEEVVLRSLPFDPMHNEHEMGGDMEHMDHRHHMGPARLPDGHGFYVLKNDERSMPHPMHLHGFRFLVLGRTGSLEQVSRLAVDDAGRTATDLGYKDTVLVWPGETVRLAVDFSHGFEGEQFYMFHCHILEHENAGMMLNVKVVSREKRQSRVRPRQRHDLGGQR
jgi:FtsP/CotA-like multicopper oxidase with cupredoxin domain